MPVLRSKASFCVKKLTIASLSITEELSKIQKPYIREEYPEDSDVKTVPVAHVPIEISIPLRIRCDLIEAKQQIEYILENCKNDKGF